jgi:hypothetical protein
MPAVSILSRAAARLTARQSTGHDEDFVAIPTAYGALSSSPSPGIVAAIVLGSVAAFLALLALVYWALNFSNPLSADYDGASTYITRTAPRSEATSRPPQRRVREMYEVRTTREQMPIVVEEGGRPTSSAMTPPRRTSTRGGGGPPPPRMVPPRRYEDEEESDEDDEIVVIEDRSSRGGRRSARRQRSPSFYSDSRSGAESSYLSGTRSGRRSRY